MKSRSLLAQAVAVVAAAVVAIALVAPSANAAGPGSVSAERPALSAVVKVQPVNGAGPQICAESPDGDVTCVAVNEDGSVADGLPPQVLAPDDGGYGTEWTVGVGWYVYLYLNRNDVHWLFGLGYAGAASVICGMLVSTIAGAFACGAGAYIIWEVIKDYVYVIPYNKCLELKFRFGFEGAKLVTRSC